jgi:hypothetical protein
MFVFFFYLNLLSGGKTGFYNENIGHCNSFVEEVSKER